MLRHFNRPIYGPNIVRREHPIKDDVFERFNSFFPSSFIKSFGFGEESPLLLDLSVERDNIIVRADLPGMDTENLTVEIDRNFLIIKSDAKETNDEDSSNYIIKERRVSSVSRSLKLPHAIDPDTATSTYKNGVLEITLPKVEKSQAKQIPIN